MRKRKGLIILVMVVGLLGCGGPGSEERGWSEVESRAGGGDGGDALKVSTHPWAWGRGSRICGEM